MNSKGADDQPTAQQVIKNLRYDIFDPEHPTTEQQALLDHLAHASAFHRDEYLTVRDFGQFSLLNEQAWPRVVYQSHLIPGGYLYWLTDRHAEMIGRALRPGLKAWALELTTLEGDGFALMARAMTQELQLDELTISHRSGDEVTVFEARGLARLATRTRAKALRLWAVEFVDGALDALAKELDASGNRTLQWGEVRDLSKDEAQALILHPGLGAFTAHNRVNA